MTLTPNEHDIAAGYTEILTAVAVRRYPDLGAGELPWPHLASSGIGWPGELDRWLRDLPDWEDHNLNYSVYTVPAGDYRPLAELGISGVEELSTCDFLATKSDVAKVQAAKPTSKSALILLDLTQFESVAHAKSIIKRFHGFDDCVKHELSAAIEQSEHSTADLAFVLSTISRSRALHEAIVREIGHDNPQAVFTLMRQFAETVALIRYTADHSKYFDTVVRDPQDLQPGMMRHRSTQALVNHMDSRYSTQFKPVYAQLCDISHFGATAVWNAHRVESEEETRTSWSSAPRWRSDNECLIACAQLLELSDEMERSLKALVRAYLDRLYEDPS